ncbi:uncharacterized protein TRIADDRAFT_55115 [Trichoplax adhaerens]|uniref:Uncharacterized protein n=1 Tax=Trichoplax adhaerens TaxID=10228 RepID=B3RU07_TRIAD|nr:predicted protein [Trichoplax adhaerens]EDV25260.1 predicted protein [Trichoplax adhaerens]|eukprot:XP_002111293.1 predicted protein [Trichoplax adhaerens]
MGTCIAPEAPKGPPAQVISSPPADYTGRNASNPYQSPAVDTTIPTGAQQQQQLQQQQQYQQPFLPPPMEQNVGQANLNHQEMTDTNTASNNQKLPTAPSAPLEMPQKPTPSVKDRVKTPPVPKNQQERFVDEQDDTNEPSRKATPPPQFDSKASHQGNDSDEDYEDIEPVDVYEEVVKQYMIFEEQIIRLKKTYSHQKLDHSHSNMKVLQENIQVATKKLEDLKRQTLREITKYNKNMGKRSY